MMETDPNIVLRAKGVYKKFGRSNFVARRQLAARLGAVLSGRSAAHKKIHQGDFWSLQDINLEVRRGEVLGVIGLNGAGKSTLLRVLYGLMTPDLGEIEVNGETGALIELGAGFEASLSGRENVFIKGALMGRTREEMEEQFPEIHAFSELGDFINSPMSSYSAGMRLRLAFAIASTISPDLLLLDEIVSVGDFTFQQKCRSRLNEMKENAGVVFATHSMNDIRSLCTETIVLEKGKIAFRGAAKDAVEFYTELQSKIEEKRIKDIVEAPKNTAGAETASRPKKDAPNDKHLMSKTTPYGAIICDRHKVQSVDHYWADGESLTTALNTWGKASLKVTCRLSEPLDKLVIGVVIWTEEGQRVTALSTDQFELDDMNGELKNFTATLDLEVLGLNPGRYVTSIAISEDRVAIYRNVLSTISVVNSRRNNGFVTLPHSWRIEKETSDPNVGSAG